MFKIEGAKGLNFSLCLIFKLIEFFILTFLGSAKKDLAPSALGPNSSLSGLRMSASVGAWSWPSRAR